MKRKSYWMWYPGDYEIYHSMKVNTNRENRGYVFPVFWRLDDCWKNVRFMKKATVTAREEICVYGNGQGYFIVDNKRHHFGTKVNLEPGEYNLDIITVKRDGLPCVYVEGDVFASGEGWLVDHRVSVWVEADYSEMYMDVSDNPEIFKFSYERLDYFSAQNVNGGILYDFGKETFGKLCFRDLKFSEAVTVYFGESMEEALDTEASYLLDEVPANTAAHTMRARAFRYVFIPGHNEPINLYADYEYLPLEKKGKFRCPDERMNQIWDVSAYTFHLNSREFFLDGIKRDRWIWSGDAYQSYLINYYLFFDKGLFKRTTIALRGKDPVEQHLNTILDYSLYWVVAIGEYHQYTGDMQFIKRIGESVKSLLSYVEGNAGEEGFLVGHKKDWVFIDWHEKMDKSGAICAIQILYWRALEVAGDLEEMLGEEESVYRKRALALKTKIDEFYWNESLGAYIDSYSSGRNNVTRHANLFAIRYGLADDARKQIILEKVIENPEIPAITTPYFKFYELDVLCSCNKMDKALAEMREYWGGMRDLGATTIWEEYDPTMKGTEHYKIWGGKYTKSLCHAWGSSPIYIFGKYVLGVRPTKPGYEEYICAPNPSGLEWIEGSVPLPNGIITVTLNNGILRVLSDCSGGTLLWRGKALPIEAGKELIIENDG